MAASPADPRRDLLLQLFRAALAAVDGRRRVRAVLAAEQGQAAMCALAVGKAAAAMMLGARDSLGPRLQRGLVVAPAACIPRELEDDPRIRCMPGSHPVPDERSLEAGQAALEFARATPPGSRVLLLVSGGASALLEVPQAGVTLVGLRAVYEDALRHGIEIEELNARRSALSQIKGGRLPGLFQGCQVDGLMISDVPRDDPSVVGSGLLAAPGCRVTLVGSLDDALDAILRAARAQGLHALRPPGRLGGEAAGAARRICHELALRGAGLLVCGGETVVHLPEQAGRGGRCQHLALAAAECISGHAEYLVLAAGTDGRDGASEDAGAIVDGGTVERATEGGFDVAASLAAADSGPPLEAAGDLIYTGDTGTNVGDIVLALRQPPAARQSM